MSNFLEDLSHAREIWEHVHGIENPHSTVTEDSFGPKRRKKVTIAETRAERPKALDLSGEI